MRFRILERLSEAGLLFWEQSQRRLFIEATVASLFIASPERWTAFFHNVHEWIFYRISSQNWEDYLHSEELAAVRNVINSEGENKLTMEDIERIKRHRRNEIIADDLEAPSVEPFEFFIIHADATDHASSENVLAIGCFDPATDSFEGMATWEEVRHFLKKDLSV